MAEKIICGICGRELGDVLIEEHHLIPKTFKGKETVTLHKVCHRAVHASIDERLLAKDYNTIEKLKTHPDIIKFAKWVAKKPLDYYSGVDETHFRKSRRRS